MVENPKQRKYKKMDLSKFITRQTEFLKEKKKKIKKIENEAYDLKFSPNLDENSKKIYKKSQSPQD